MEKSYEIYDNNRIEFEGFRKDIHSALRSGYKDKYMKLIFKPKVFPIVSLGVEGNSLSRKSRGSIKIISQSGEEIHRCSK